MTADSTCPLCQEPLSDLAKERLKRFDAYIKDDVAKTAKLKRERLAQAVTKIEQAPLQVPLDDALREELVELDASLPDRIGDFVVNLEGRRAAMLACAQSFAWSSLTALEESPGLVVRQFAARMLCESRAYARASDEEARRKITAEHAELLARQNLSKSLEAVLALGARLKKKATLEKCRKDLQTRAISDKSKKFTSAAVTDGLKLALDKEFDALGIGHIKTKLKKRSSQGKMYHQLLLDLTVDQKLEEILSEGQQRVIALASFLAELEMGNHCCGIVFDDPVSSLDHKWRRRIAQRLIKESQRRQVIVFTHEIVFLDQLRDEGGKVSIEPQVCFLEWSGEQAGFVREGLPWIHKSIGERIDTLEKAQRAFVRLPWPADPSEAQTGAITRQYSFLRSTIERIVQDHILNGTVQRFRDYIDVKKIAGVVGIEQTEVDELLRLTQRCHDIVEAHDPSSAKNEPPPTPSELKQDIEDLKTLITAIKDRRNTSS